MDDWDEIFKGPHWNLLANGEWATANFKPWVGILATSVGYHDFSTGLRSAPTKNLQIYISFSCYLIFSLMCMFSRSLFVLLYFFFGHCLVCSSLIYRFWLPPFGIFKLFYHQHQFTTYVYSLSLRFLCCVYVFYANKS